MTISSFLSWKDIILSDKARDSSNAFLPKIKEVVGLIFWINPQFAGSLSLAPVIIITVPLFGCVILWILVLQYAIRLCLLNEIKTIVVIIICVDALLEGFSAALIISANVYCAGLSSFSELNGFNYSKIYFLVIYNSNKKFNV